MCLRAVARIKEGKPDGISSVLQMWKVSDLTGFFGEESGQLTVGTPGSHAKELFVFKGPESHPQRLGCSGSSEGPRPPPPSPAPWQGARWPPPLPNITLSPLDSLRERDSSLDQSTCLLQLLHPLPTELPPQGVAHARSPAVQCQPGAPGRARGGGGRCRLRFHGKHCSRPPARAPHQTINVSKVTHSELSLAVEYHWRKVRESASFGCSVCKDGSTPSPSFSAQDYICNQITWRRRENFVWSCPLFFLPTCKFGFTSSVLYKLC